MIQSIKEESILIPIISSSAIPQIKKSKNNRPFNFLTELDCGYGIADVVFYNLDKKIVSKRYSNKLLQFTKGQLQTILALQENKSVSITYLKKRLSFSEAYIKYHILRFLIENGIITEDNQEYRLSFDYVVGLKETIAIEAKLQDWKKGLYQAYRYKWFAEESYLAIYEKNLSRPLKALEQFKKLNVGLMSVGRNGVEIIFKPTPEEPYSKAMRALSYEKILSVYFTERSSASVSKNHL